MGRHRRIESGSREETLSLGKHLGQDLLPGSLILLSGDYGAGKTEFVRGIVRGYLGDHLGGDVASPSFSGLFVYENNGRRVLHYDLYRFIDSFDESVFDDAEDADVLCIEWAEVMGEVDSSFREVIKVDIIILEGGRRELSITFVENI